MLPQRERDFGARRTSSQLLEAFFPHVGSVAALAARAEGYALSGSCFAQAASQHLADAISVVLPQREMIAHGLAESSHNTVRALLTAFARDSARVNESAPLRFEAALCERVQKTKAAAEYECAELGAEPLVSPPASLGGCMWSAYRPHFEFYAVGPQEECAVAPRTTTASPVLLVDEHQERSPPNFRLSLLIALPTLALVVGLVLGVLGRKCATETAPTDDPGVALTTPRRHGHRTVSSLASAHYYSSLPPESCVQKEGHDASFSPTHYDRIEAAVLSSLENQPLKIS